MNNIVINIDGVEYVLKGEEKEEYLQNVARFVDNKIKRLKTLNDKLSTTSVAVLTAVNICDELFKKDQQLEAIKTHYYEVKNSDNKLRDEIENLRSNVKNLSEMNEELKYKIDYTDISLIKEKDEDIKTLRDEIIKVLNENKTLKEEYKFLNNDFEKLKNENRNLKIKLNSSNDKIIDLKNEIIEHQVELIKFKQR